MGNWLSGYMKDNGPVDRVRIKQVLMRQSPSWADAVDNAAAFVAAKSGGVEGQCIHAFGAVHRVACKGSTRMVPGEVFAALADFPFRMARVRDARSALHVVASDGCHLLGRPDP